MGRLHEAVRQIDDVIARKGLDLFKTRGLISLKVGFMLGCIQESTPDDPSKIEALTEAAEEVLGEKILI